MKTIKLTIIIASLFISLHSNGQSTGIKATETFMEKMLRDYYQSVDDVKNFTTGKTVSQPTEAVHYLHDGVEWSQQSKTIYTYSAAGTVAKEVFLYMNFTTGNYDTSYSLEYTYTPNGYIQQIIKKDYFNNNWLLNSKDLYTYDNAGHLIEEVQYKWSGSNWVLFSGTRKQYLFNDNNLYYITWFNYDNASVMWKAVKQAVSSYVDNKPETVTFYDMDGSAYFEYIQFDSLTWFDIDSKSLKSAVVNTWITNMWQKSGKLAYQYSGEGRVIHKLYNNYLFAIDKHSNYGYDLSGNLIALYTEQNDLSTPGLFVDNGFKIFENFDMQNREISEYIENYDVDTDLWITNEKYEFTYAQISTGISNPSKEIKFVAFPNPVKDQLKITANGIEQPATITIFDIIGKEVFRSEFSELNSETIDVSQLRSGNYIISINTEGFSKAIKFVKQ